MSLPSGVSARPVLPGARLLQGSSQGYVIAIISAMLLAFTAIIIRVLTEYYHLPTFVLAFWRAALVALVLLPVLLLFKPEWARLQRSQVPFYACYGLLLAVFNSLWTLSVALNGASVATILTYCSVGFTVFLGWMMYSERLSLRQLVVIVVSLGGCFLVSNGDSMGNSHFNLLGLLVGMLSGIGYTLYTLGGAGGDRTSLPGMEYHFVCVRFFSDLSVGVQCCADVISAGRISWHDRLVVVLVPGRSGYRVARLAVAADFSGWPDVVGIRFVQHQPKNLAAGGG
ncbi:Predicted permease, DMT superfamily [Serratia grimesii]|nr:Predicted permease, DMT superfamily [Serratia grimesii]